MPIRNFEANLRQPTLQLKEAMVIDLLGEVNGTVETVLNAAYEQAESLNPATIILNFSDVDYMNSTGIALVVGLLARARKTGRKLSVFGLSEHYADIFNITRLSDFMDVFSDESSALAKISVAH